MSTIAKLRLTNLAFHLAAVFTLGSLAALLLNVSATATDPTTGERTTTHLFGREWYREHLLGLIPQQGIIIGLVTMMVLACLYEYYFSRTRPADIATANQALRDWTAKYWLKLLALIIALSLAPAILVRT